MGSFGAHMSDIADSAQAESRRLRAQLDAIREAAANVLKFAKPSRGDFCGTECLGQCDECRALAALRKAIR